MGELALLITAIVGALSAITGSLVWVGKKLVDMGRIMAELERSTKATESQVSNSHTSNLRDDLTLALGKIDELETTVKSSLGEHGKIWSAIRQVRNIKHGKRRHT